MNLLSVTLATLMTSVGLAGGEISHGQGRISIISVGALTRELSRWSIIDARETGEFEKGHIPGSRPMKWRDWTLQSPGLVGYLFGNPAKWGKVPAPTEGLQERLREAGLSNTRAIVIAGKPGAWGEEGRIAWNLLYWGANEVALLDGGYPAWRASGRPIETGEAKAISKGDFLLAIRSKRRAEKEEVLHALQNKNRTILDARNLVEFNGKQVTAQKRGGHLPGAVLIPVTSLYQEDGSYISNTALRDLVPRAAKHPIAYCVGGVRSALLALLIEARLGMSVANYEGSLWEWASDPVLPLEK